MERANHALANAQSYRFRNSIILQSQVLLTIRHHGQRRIALKFSRSDAFQFPPEPRRIRRRSSYLVFETRQQVHTRD